MLRVSVALALLAATCVLVSADVLSTRTQPPAGWSIQRRAPSTAPLRFFLALKQRNLDVLESKFWSVSNPNSAEYRQFLSISEISDIIAPKSEDVSVVINWLLVNGVASSQISTFVDALEVRTTISVAEHLFQTEFYEFLHAKWGRSILRQYGSFSVPSSVRSRIDMVMGISNFPHYNPDRLHVKKPSDLAATDFGVVPQTTYSLYNVPAQQTSAQATSQGVIEFDQEDFSPRDLQEYATLTGIPIPALTKDHIVGPHSGLYPGTEATLDIQFIATVDSVSTNWFWLEDNNAWLYGFTTHFFNTTTVPQVVSISYGWWEGDQCSVAGTECQTLGVKDLDYVARVNVEFQKIGLRGVSILVSSGDSGAHTRTDEDCTAKTLRAEFPAASPYVTSVGATQITNPTELTPEPKICTQYKVKCAATGTEVAVSFAVADFTSGGGFSEVASQPDYQAAAVKAYLSSSVKFPPVSYYNASNRAHPDVAAVGNMNLIYQSSVQAVGGTSASAPIFASVVSLLNQASIAKSGQPLGFLNPLLYQIYADNPKAFNDITSGDNICTESGCALGCKGWYATTGWDPVTGLGTPNYQVLLQEVQKLGDRTSNVAESR